MGSKDIENYLKSEDVNLEDFIRELLKVQGVNRTILAKIILGVEPNHIIQEMFMGYKQRKQRRQKVYTQRSFINREQRRFLYQQKHGE